MRSVLVSAVLAFSTASCTPIKSLFQSSPSQSQSTPQPAQQPKPLVSNAFAYARYVALNLSLAKSMELSVAEVENILFENALNSKISAEDMLLYLSAGPVELAKEGESTSKLRFDEFNRQVAACSSKSYSKEECCRALAWPLAVLPQLTNQEGKFTANLLENARNEKNKELALKSWQSLTEPASAESDDASQARSYRLAGLKAWLGACHVVLNKAPENMNEFRKVIASDLNNKSLWNRTLHAKSRAKRGPRRVFSKNDASISVAETLNPDCTVKETEVIRRRADGSLDYWVYDAAGLLTPLSHFPAPSKDNMYVTVDKLSPDSCMGCHYSFESRQFDQLKVSADLLRLPKTSDLPVVCLQPDDVLANDN